VNFSAIISRFADAAQNYCAWLEAAPGSTSEEHFTATRLVAELYAAALCLPETEPTDGDTPSLTPEQRLRVEERLGAFPFQFYWEIFEPFTSERTDATCGDIMDDLGDIYCDVKDGLMVYSQDEQAAVWHWRTTFGFHWGRHATSALRALHSYDPEAET
jgi:hypothetical protein